MVWIDFDSYDISWNGEKAACYLDWYVMFSELLLIKDILIKDYFS